MNEKDREIIHETVYATLKGIGFKMDDPIEIQADIQCLRSMRKRMEGFSRSLQNTVVVVVTTGLLYGVWEIITQ